MILYHAELEGPLPTFVFQKLCSSIPENWKRKVLAFTRWEDAHLSLMGKLLLKQGLDEIGNGQFSLNDVKYSEFGKPFIDGCFDFSISHSERRVVCLFSSKIENQVGVDIEYIKTIDLEDYASVFNKSEWLTIKQSEHSLREFYSCWTKKEAIVKAIGCGLNFPLQEINTANQTDIVLNEKVLFIQEINCFDKYALSMASSECFHATVQLRKAFFL
jgi:4'-phosphopantetheinyl transferase